MKRKREVDGIEDPPNLKQGGRFCLVTSILTATSVSSLEGHGDFIWWWRLMFWRIYSPFNWMKLEYAPSWLILVQRESQRMLWLLERVRKTTSCYTFGICSDVFRFLWHLAVPRWQSNKQSFQGRTFLSAPSLPDFLLWSFSMRSRLSSR